MNLLTTQVSDVLLAHGFQPQLGQIILSLRVIRFIISGDRVVNNHHQRFGFSIHTKSLSIIIATLCITPADTSQAVLAEVTSGAAAAEFAFGDTSYFYRDATALYSSDKIALIENTGFQIDGFSLNGDWGASDSAAPADQNIAQANDGDIIIAYMN